MSKPKRGRKHRIIAAMALMFIIPFAAGLVRAAEPPKPAPKPITAPPATPAQGKPPPPTIDTNNDGKPDAWDRDANSLPDAWDVNNDGKPDLFDEDGDGRPDDKRAPPPPEDESPEDTGPQ